MNQTDLEGIMELGLLGLALVILTSPIWLTAWAWRTMNSNEY